MVVTDIIVLGYNLPEMEVACIDSIIKNTKSGSYVITYFDNFNSGKTLTQAWNFLIKNSICDYICLLNSDAQVTRGWLDLLEGGFSWDTYLKTPQLDHKIAFVGPSTNSCHSPQKAIATAEAAQKYIGKPDSVEIMKDPISGFCLMFRKKLWKELGGFDEEFDFYGAESDFIDKAQKLGYSCAWVKSAFVYHIGEASIKASGRDPKVERSKALALYRAKRSGR